MSQESDPTVVQDLNPTSLQSLTDSRREQHATFRGWENSSDQNRVDGRNESRFPRLGKCGAKTPEASPHRSCNRGLLVITALSQQRTKLAGTPAIKQRVGDTFWKVFHPTSLKHKFWCLKG